MLRLAVDENLDPVLTEQVRRQGVDIVQLRDAGLLGAPDDVVLDWLASEGHQLITRDSRTMIGLAYERVLRGESMQGIFVLRRGVTFAEAIEAVALAAMASEPSEWEGRVVHIPLQ
jgi:predicted nuclease of predicted toxin-antitoxin system